MKHLLKSLMAGAALVLSFSGVAAANEWKVGTLLPEGEEPDSPQDGLYLLAENAEGPALMLGCSERLGVQARIYLNGATQDTLTLEKVRRVRTRMVEIDTESTEAKKYVWAYLQQKGELISVAPWQGKRLFNSAVKGEDVNLDILKIGQVVLDLPEVNDDFRTFASACEATNPSSSAVASDEVSEDT